MPVRVKCRCGQETVLRYGEWVYVLLGLVLAGLAVNTALVVLFWMRLDALERAGQAGAPAVSGTPGAPEAITGEPTGAQAVSDEATGPLVARAGPARDAGASQNGTLEEPGEEDPAGPAEPDAERGAEPPRGETSPRRLVEGDAVAVAPDLLETLAASFTPSLDRAQDGPSATAPAADGPATVSAVPAPALLPGSGALLRLWLLEKERADTGFVCAFLLDPDPWLRARAVAFLREHSHLATALRDDGVASVVRAALPDLHAAARAFLEPFIVSRQESPVRFEAIERELTARREAVRPLLESANAESLARALRRWSTAGVDVALLVDVSKSMEEPLAALQRSARWWGPAFAWAVPRGRLALILYRDRVEGHADFSELPLDEVLPLLREARAEGGGDVPEGVHEALRRAFEIGALRWRADAEKHIIVVGDAPAPYRAEARTVRLAEQAHRQGTYRVHALVFETDDESRPLAFFRELGRRGGGRVLTPEPDALGEALISCLWGEDVTHLDEVTALLRGAFTQR